MADDARIANRLTDLEESVDFILEANGGELASKLKAFLTNRETPRRVLSAFEPGKSQEAIAREARVQQPAVSKALKQLKKKNILALEIDESGKKTGGYRLSKIARIFHLQDYAREGGSTA